MKLLVAEDTVDLNRVICAMLDYEGYQTDSAYDGGQALDLLRTEVYDGVILDIMMPVMSGLEVLEKLRSEGNDTPVLLLTARSEVDDRVAGLDAGANDYLAKPFAMKELFARVRAMLRTQAARRTDLTYRDLRLNGEDLSMTASNSVALSPREFELMNQLIRSQGRPLETDRLLERLWQNEPDAAPADVRLYISFLRAKLASVDSAVTIAGGEEGPYSLV